MAEVIQARFNVKFASGPEVPLALVAVQPWAKILMPHLDLIVVRDVSGMCQGNVSAFQMDHT